MVVGTVLSVTLDYAKKHLTCVVEAAVAVLATFIALSGMNLLWAVAAGFIAGASTQRRHAVATPGEVPAPLRWRRFAVPLACSSGMSGHMRRVDEWRNPASLVPRLRKNGCRALLTCALAEAAH